MNHEYYEPNEYEQCFIAAGIMQVSQLDSEYQDYLRRTKGDEYQMSYDHWNATRRELDRLTERYEREIEPLYLSVARLTYEQKELSDRLARQMTRCEIALGY